MRTIGTRPLLIDDIQFWALSPALSSVAYIPGKTATLWVYDIAQDEHVRLGEVWANVNNLIEWSPNSSAILSYQRRDDGIDGVIFAADGSAVFPVAGSGLQESGWAPLVGGRPAHPHQYVVGGELMMPKSRKRQTAPSGHRPSAWEAGDQLAAILPASSRAAGLNASCASAAFAAS